MIYLRRLTTETDLENMKAGTVLFVRIDASFTCAAAPNTGDRVSLIQVRSTFIFSLELRTFKPRRLAMTASLRSSSGPMG